MVKVNAVNEKDVDGFEYVSEHIITSHDDVPLVKVRYGNVIIAQIETLMAPNRYVSVYRASEYAEALMQAVTLYAQAYEDEATELKETYEPVEDEDEDEDEDIELVEEIHETRKSNFQYLAEKSQSQTD